MHPCLQVPELRTLIIRHLAHADDSANGSGQPKGHLARLARTCRAFHAAAIPSIWHELSSVTPIVKTMPDDLWEENTNAAGQTTLSFRRPINSADWTRLRIYSVHVKSFSPAFYPATYMRTKSVTVLSDDAYRILDVALSAAPLFPHCHSVSWGIGTRSFYPFLRALLNPNLRNLQLHFASQTANITNLSLLSTISDSCPALSCFILSINTATPMLNRYLSNVLSTWTHLSELHLPFLDGPLLAVISTLPELASLHIDLYLDASSSMAALYTYSSSQQSINNAACFPALQSLHLQPFDVVSPPFLRLKSTWTPLKALNGITERTTRPQSWKTCIESLSSSAPYIEEVVLETHGSSSSPRPHPPPFNATAITGSPASNIANNNSSTNPGDPDSCVIEPLTLAPLLELSRLRLVRMTNAIGFDLDDAFLSCLARALPLIEILHLLPEEDGYNARCPRVTLRGLVPFARYCPRLVDLGVAVDATHLPPPPPPPTPLSSTHSSSSPSPADEEPTQESSLHTLTLRDSEVHPNMAPAASFLSSTFPKLARVTCGEGFEQNTEWIVVEELVGLFREAREKERRRVIKGLVRKGKVRWEDVDGI